jgi:hypothetical protein
MKHDTLSARWHAHENILETELPDGWLTQQHFVIQDGRRVVDWLRICPAPQRGSVQRKWRPGELPGDGETPAGGVTARLLRTIKVGDPQLVIDDYRSWIEEHFGAEALRRLDAHPSRRRTSAPKRQRATDAFYAELAQDYVTVCQKGSRTPTQDLAALRNTPIKKMRSHIHLARTGDFLTDTRRGKVGGELTDKAKRVLQELSRTTRKEK